MLDKEDFDANALNLLIVSTNVSKVNLDKKVIMDPLKGLVRYEWMELLVRIAKKKFLDPDKNKDKYIDTVKDENDAIIKLLDEYLVPVMTNHSRV